jgi:hypothetical protein
MKTGLLASALFVCSCITYGQSARDIVLAAPQAPRIKADTAGHGTYEGRESRPITRGYFETLGEPSVALSDEREFRIRFRCEIVENRRDREFRLRIVDSDRGEASGTAFVRLNHDRNEIEVIEIRGRHHGRRIFANFARN